MQVQAPGESRSDLWQVMEFSKRFKMEEVWPKELLDQKPEYRGKTITFRFNKPWADFPLAAAGMMMTDPYKESLDKGDRSKWTLFSNGPYKLEGGVWDKNKGGTFVRNDQYSAETDSPEELRLPTQHDLRLPTADRLDDLVGLLVAVDRQAAEIEQGMVEIPAVDRIGVLVLADIGQIAA